MPDRKRRMTVEYREPNTVKLILAMHATCPFFLNLMDKFIFISIFCQYHYVVYLASLFFFTNTQMLLKKVKKKVKNSLLLPTVVDNGNLPFCHMLSIYHCFVSQDLVSLKGSKTATIYPLY